MREKKPFLYNIRTRLIVAFVVVSFLSMLVATFYSISAFDQYISKEFSERLGDSVDTAFLIYQLKEETLRNLVRLVSEDKVVGVTLKIGLREQLANYIFGILKENNLNLLTITNQSGIVVARGGNFSAFGDDVSDDPLIKRALESPAGTIVVGTERISLEEATEEKLLQKVEVRLSDGNVLQSGLALKVATPIFFEEKVIGVVVVGYLLNNSEIVEEIKKEIGVDVYILQADIVVSTSLKNDLSILGDKIDLEKEVFQKEGKEYLIAYHFLESIEKEKVGALVISADIQELIATKSKIRNNLLLISIVSIILSILLAVYISYVIANPIHKTTIAMIAVGKGDLSQRVEIKRKDEVGEFIKAFNQMAGDLNKSITALEESRNVLEVRVATRTKELQELAKNLEEKVGERTKELTIKIREIEESKQALLNILEDVEESRILAEEEKNKTLALITNFSDGVLFFDSKNKVSLANIKIQDFFSIQYDEIIDSSLEELNSLESLKPLISLIGSGLKIIMRTREELALGSGLVLEVTTIPIELEGQKLGTLLILHDITREKSVERLKTEFVAIAAHQLRTPLSAIKWTLRMFLDGDIGQVSQAQSELLQKTYDSNERMISLVNDLLNVTRIEEGKFLQKIQKCDVADLLQEAVKPMEDIIKKKKLKLSLFLPSKKAPSIEVDKEKVILAIQNLLDNAVNYTKEGEILLAGEYIPAQKEFLIKVKDAGIGIPKEQHGRVFSRFFRSSNAVKTETEGTGLGLFIAKNIVEVHGGKIWFESVEGHGTTFYFTLPVGGIDGKNLK